MPAAGIRRRRCASTVGRVCTGTTISTRAELIDGGLTRRAIARGVREGRLTRLRRGTYATTDVCPQMLSAALHGGALACITAARHLGLWILSDDQSVHVWLTGARREYEHPACTCVPHWDAGESDLAFSIPPVTRVLRQILACVGVEEFFVALESALRQGLLDDAGVEWLRQNTNKTARRAMDHARADADSGLESLLRWRLRRHGLAVRTQVRIPSTGRVDLLIGDSLIVEADGRENHAGADHRHKDLVRDATAAMWGFSTLRFDYAMIVHDWDLVERAILGRLAATGPR